MSFCPGPAAQHPAGYKSTYVWLCPERPRFCLLSKEEGGSFGFHLQQELGGARHVVCRVEPGTSAQRQEGWALPTRPRCLHLEKGPQGFGFLLREEKGLGGRLGQFLWEVDPGLPADKAGMQAGDRLVAVAGESCCLYPGPGGGYGFRLSYVASGPRLSISQVTPGGSAARAGLQQGDEILEVNGRPVDGEDDVDRLHQLAEAEPPLCLKLGARSPRGWSGL
ncbi:PREDICTED: Na(+)/H(+) exchange regulatory cofactor NHE-RF4 [Myotis brandtii]|uniref:Na(+)/H(+) exchange regulatory cofactor NHE-RF4 n=1 Tax=Myotis brandtii TaxID=109478 RepID=UPI0007047CDB|nr:PREDICTED: Na(+)/H(+) exchange regulatory cofactor NHE-RF4 [Myotis brandtii]